MASPGSSRLAAEVFVVAVLFVFVLGAGGAFVVLGVVLEVNEGRGLVGPPGRVLSIDRESIGSTARAGSCPDAARSSATESMSKCSLIIEPVIGLP